MDCLFRITGSTVFLNGFGVVQEGPLGEVHFVVYEGVEALRLDQCSSHETVANFVFEFEH